MFVRGDLVRVIRTANNSLQLAQLPEVQAALIALNPQDSAIKSLVGGFDFRHSRFNRVTQAFRQPGSSFKPFIYTTALNNGFTAASVINDAPVVFNDKNLEDMWRPENDGGKFYGPTRLREALYRSRNMVSIRLLRRMGIDRTLEGLLRFGFDTGEMPLDLSLALGSHAMTPLKVASAYNMIANGGYSVSPYLLAAVIDRMAMLSTGQHRIRFVKTAQLLPTRLPTVKSLTTVPARGQLPATSFPIRLTR